MEQSIIEGRTCNLYAFGEHKGTLELTGGNTTMQVNPLIIVALLPFDDQLPILNLNTQFVVTKTRNGETNSQTVFGKLFDIVRRISVRRRLRGSVQQIFKFVKA